ncbi:hypothetical protein [Enterovibrio norvegicus]|nr:hypothetical protein [Enterovibrio norvegicus]TKF35211.1 hypothetical protein FCV83_05795 [Enterovibrio norvegicus]
MFKKRRVNLIQCEIDEQIIWLKSLSEKTEEIRENAFYNIAKFKEPEDRRWQEITKNECVSKELFQLMLHRQFIGYAAESVRKLTMKKMRIEGTAPSPLDVEEYTKVIEYGLASKEMEKLFKLFLEEMEPVFEKYYEETHKDNF